MSILNCSEDSSTGPGDAAYIRILEPKPGAQVKLDEDLRIITESDYDKFRQKLTFTATTDSGKTWQAFIISLEPRTGMNVKDTVVCNFGALGLAAGEKTRIKVIEYGKVHSAVSDVISILP
jgi:hypothetical protein